MAEPTTDIWNDYRLFETPAFESWPGPGVAWTALTKADDGSFEEVLEQFKFGQSVRRVI